MRTRFLIITAVTLGLIAGCGKSSKKKETKKQPDPIQHRVVIDPPAQAALPPGIVKGLDFTLETGPGALDASARIKHAKGLPLTDAEIKAILGRLPAAKEPADLRKAFALRDRSLPPPRTGETIKTPFPPPPKPLPAEKPDPGKLSIVRHSPTTDVYIAPNISVTFSQPMIPVTSHADSIAKGVPLKIEPNIPGKWRWLGTKTLIFESDLERLPKSTHYKVTVPAEVKSALGTKLEKEYTWEFTTPTINVETIYPQGGPQFLDPIFYIRFDQRVDPAAVLATISMTGPNSSNIPLKLVKEDEWKKDKTIKSYMEVAKREFEGRHFVFRPTIELTKASYYAIEVGPGTPSKEGNLKSKEGKKFSITTYSPLAIDYSSCEKRYKCRPPYGMSLRFNNGIDEKNFREDMITVTPKIEDMHITVAGRYMSISGKVKGRRDYVVKISPKLGDIYGQFLGKEEERTFYYREAYPTLSSNYKMMTVADPSSKAEIRFQSMNIPKIRVAVYRVGPSDYPAFKEYSRRYRYDTQVPPPPGNLAMEKVYDFPADSDEMVETVVSLEKLVNKKGNGQFFVQVSQVPRPEKNKYNWKTFVTWLQFTKIAVDAHMDKSHMIALVTNLKDGKAVSDAAVDIHGGPSGKTDSTGITTISLPSDPGKDLGEILVAKTSGDIAILPKSMYSYYMGYGKYTRGYRSSTRFIYFTFDDRKLYKPKETVNVKGYMRIAGMEKDATLKLPEGATEVSFTVYDPRGNKIGEGKVPVNALGGFNLKFTLPDNTNLGQGRVELKTNTGNNGNHYFTIAEFRKPEFEVSVTSNDGPFILGGRADLTLNANYFSGGGLPGAEVSWSASASKTYFSPPKMWEYSFGDQAQRWWFYSYSNTNTSTSKSLAGTTDSRGRHSVRMEFKGMDPTLPYTVNAHATVTDVNRQSWTANKTVLVHPADRYVGLKTKKYFVNKGTPMVVDIVVVDIDGKKIDGADVNVTAYLEEWRYKMGKYQKLKGPDQKCSVKSASSKDARCTFKTEKGGSYVIRAEIIDSKGRKNFSRITRYVSGGALPPVRKVEREKVNMILDKKAYKPGDTAEIFIQSPFFPAEVLWFTNHAGIDKPQRFTMTSPTAVIKVPLTEEHMPGTQVQVELTGASARMDNAGLPVKNAPARPAYAGGTIHLPVSLDSRKLELRIMPVSSQLKPGGKTVVNLQVLDYQGKPVPDAEIALVAVDEAVLALTGYKLSNPLNSFHPSRIEYVASRWLREMIQLDDPVKLAEEFEAKQQALSKDSRTGGIGIGGGGGLGGRFGSKGLKNFAAETAAPAPRSAMSVDKMDDAPGAKPERSKMKKAPRKARNSRDEDNTQKGPAIEIRTNFDALALFAPEVKTDAEGKASVELKLPDNLTRYRLMAVTVAGATKYGMSETNVTARLPLQLRQSPPRFLNFGDRFELPIVVQNQTGSPQDVKVAIRGYNVRFKGPKGLKITVPAGDRRELRFDVATDMPGTAKFEAVAVSGEGQDAASFSLPVWTPATTEGFATYGTIDKGAIIQPVQVPGNVVMEFGGLNVQTSSTQLQALTDAVLYLYSYPYECAEQLASRILSIAALRDVLTAFQAAGLPAKDAIEAAMARDLTKLANMQNYDGGFGFWIRGQESWPFLTIHVAHAFLRAKEKGYAVNANVLSRAMSYLRYIENHIPSTYPEWVKRYLKAYSIYVRNLNKDVDVAAAKKLYPHFAIQKQPYLEGIGWIYPVFAAAKDKYHLEKIRKLLLNRVTETAGNANFITYAADGAHLILHSNRRVDALLLSAMIIDQPKSDLITKVVSGLLAHKTKGRWANTQESVWVLLALDQYFNTYEKVTPNFVSRMWLGERYAGDHKFIGRTTERHLVKIPMLDLGNPGKVSKLLLSKEGA
ncbi:Ig-like domain-containing protein, partial [Myxococcota bacterium]|nr:Ig-like domain-containing protein [Myxococcota bacterium]